MLINWFDRVGFSGVNVRSGPKEPYQSRIIMLECYQYYSSFQFYWCTKNLNLFSVTMLQNSAYEEKLLIIVEKDYLN
jgi:hypothetical protein